MNRLTTGVIWIVLTLVSIPSLLAMEGDWPRTIPLEQGMVTIYSLQVDEMKEGNIKFRAALAYRTTAASEPVFGAGWFESPVEIDAANQIVHPTNLKVTETRFPAGTKDIESELSGVLATQSPDWNLDFSVDELETALKQAEAETKATQNLNTTPPDIIYRDHPALLISMDGEPLLREIENSPYKAVINTPYPLITDEKHYYLNAAKDVWYRAREATGPYQFDKNPPADIVAMVKPDEESAATETGTETVTAANAPEIVVSTKPAELLVTDGPAAFVPLVDDLLVLQNSDDDVFMHVSSQKYYIVLAGRWYQADSLNGPWAYQLADDLPTAFADIPKDSEQADSRVYVAGTEEAREAVLDAEVPQTAAVKRGEVDIEVEYDGEPIYEPVDGTELVYIQNTGSTVLVSDGLYYLVENGVWYVSASANGPWQVSDHRPEQVDTILPTSPVYNTKYVRVYESTPNVVYVGYTPGYTGSYVYHNTIFYGTGWYYRPWISPYYYYPRFSTWGFNVSYNSWSGWNFGLSWGWGPFSVGYYSGGYWHNNHNWHHRHYGHWGPRGYRPRPVHYGHRGNRYSHNNDRYNNRDRNGGNGRNGNGRNDYAGNDRRDNEGRNDRSDRRSNRNERGDNLYRDDSQRARVANTRDKQATPAERRANSTRQANNANSLGSRQKNDSSTKKGERNRTGPVRASDLRVKADVLAVNSRDSRNTLLADNSGNVYRGASNLSERKETVSRRSISAKSPKTRASAAEPVRKRNPSQNSSRSNNRASGKSTAKQKTQPVTGRSPRQSQVRVTNKQSSKRSSNAGKTPTQRTQPTRSDKNSKQRSSAEPKMRTQKQNTARQNPKPQGSQSNARNNPVPAQSARNSRPNNSTSAQRPKNSGRNNPTPAKSSRNNGQAKSKPTQSTGGRSSQKSRSTNRGKRDQRQ